MLIQSESRFIPSLKAVWKNVFGDEDEYIDLFFSSVFKKCKTFAFFENEKIVSVLYLLDCKIRFGGELFSGYYLYAAATEKEYRKKGIMQKLISEAEEYSEKNGKDFISLVPANDGLYRYYSKFGFQTAMYKCADESVPIETVEPKTEKVSASEYTAFRFENTENAFLWETEEMNYVFSCFAYYNTYAFKTEDSFFILNEEENEIKELLCKKEAFEKGKNSLSALNSKEALQITSRFGKTKLPFGMIYPINKKLKRQWSKDDIYMNLALD